LNTAEIPLELLQNIDNYNEYHLDNNEARATVAQSCLTEYKQAFAGTRTGLSILQLMHHRKAFKK